MVSIAAHLQIFKVHAPSIPQYDGTVDLTILMVLLKGRFRYVFHDLRIRSNLPKSMVEIYFVIRAPGVSNLKPCFLPYANLPESMIRWTPVLLNRWLCFHFENLAFQPDQRFCGPFLDQRSRSPSGLRTTEISNLKLTLWIRRP
jgi:hypothetical protein